MAAKKHTEKKYENPEIRLVTLSTCYFCNKAKKMLEVNGFTFTFIDLDLLPEEERDRQMSEIRIFNPEESFPIVIIGNSAIVGFQEERIKKELGIT